MGTDVADYNNDGLLDMMTVDMEIEGNYGTKTFMQSNKQTFLRTRSMPVTCSSMAAITCSSITVWVNSLKWPTCRCFTTGWSWFPVCRL